MIRDGSASFDQIMRKSLKYKNTPTMVGDIRFDSKAEAKRYSELLLLSQGKQIAELQRQVGFVLYGKNGSPVCRYRADFMYTEGEKIVVEDVKGMLTKDFRIKQKLFNDNYPDIDFRIVKKK